MEHYALREETINAVLRYLQNKPYIEVCLLIEKVKQGRLIKEADPVVHKPEETEVINE